MAARSGLRAAEKYLTIINSLGVGFCIVQLIYDVAQKPIDYRHLECNPAFEQHTGLANAAGKTIRELTPDVEEF